MLCPMPSSFFFFFLQAMLTSESVRGRDHPETMRDIIFLGQYLRVINQRDRAITVLQHARDLCSIAVDTFHQEYGRFDPILLLLFWDYFSHISQPDQRRCHTAYTRCGMTHPCACLSAC